MNPSRLTFLFRCLAIAPVLFVIVLVVAASVPASAQTKGQAAPKEIGPPSGIFRFAMIAKQEEALSWRDLLQLPITIDVDGVGKGKAHIVNGSERIPVDTDWNADTKEFSIEMPHYASRVSLTWDSKSWPTGTGGWRGTWTKRRGKGGLASVDCAGPLDDPSLNYSNPSKFLGRWEVAFQSEDDLAVGVFEKAEDSNEVYGTFLTTTGDYRYLAGGVSGNELTLSCFDGGHAFLFKAVMNENGSIAGSFTSGNWYSTTWSAKRNENASLPDAFKQTTWTGKVELSELKFPGLDGVEVALDDEKFAGKCRIIEVFGSWCPNCHDAGVYLSELHNKYKARGLSVTGLAFELTGDLEKDTAQVMTFIKRNKTDYPILIAGTADKSEATEQLKLLDRVRSYPTMIFLDQGGNVRAIYTGFSGPATGEAHAKLREQFEKLIEGILDE